MKEFKITFLSLVISFFLIGNVQLVYANTATQVTGNAGIGFIEEEVPSKLKPVPEESKKTDDNSHRDNKKHLPQTDEKSSLLLISIGIFILSITGMVLFKKKSKIPKV